MHATFAIESNDSPAPGIIPEPVHVHDQPAKPTRRTGQPPAGRATKLLPAPGQRNPVSIVLARVMRVIRGDRYMIDAYPPAWHSDAPARDSAGLVRQNHNDARTANAQSTPQPEPSDTDRAAPAESQANKR